MRHVSVAVNISAVCEKTAVNLLFSECSVGASQECLILLPKKRLIWKIQAEYVIYVTCIKLGILSYSEYEYVSV